MKIGLLMTSIGNFGLKNYYNSQEIGLAKALDKIFDEVKVYKLISSDDKECTEKIKDCSNATIYMIPARKIGSSGFLNLSILDKNLDILIYFSDTQIALPKVFNWAKINKVKFLPYIGTLKSHSVSNVKRILINLWGKRNLKIYKKSHCLVKTYSIEKKLRNMGVKYITVAPVGLDTSLLYLDYAAHPVDKLKLKYGFNTEDKIILFIGRLTKEKQPFRMLDIFSQLVLADKNYRLLIVGTGELKEQMLTCINKSNYENKVKILNRIPNCNIWELYRICDVFVNLNQHEIFGMAILEAMYYECKVVAWNAPGPNMIIEDGISGYLSDSNAGIINAVIHKSLNREMASKRISEHFIWDITAEKIKKTIGIVCYD